jgi:hypothetical protein
MTPTAIYDDLLEACRQEGCPLCRLEHAADLRYLERLFYAQVNDYNTRQQLRASLGFCVPHAELALSEVKGQALGLAIIYDDLLRLVVEQIDKNNTLLAADKKCPACENRDENNARVLSELSKYMLNESMQSALGTSTGLCLGHLRQALAAMREPAKRAALLKVQRAIMLKLRAELAEYIRKNDYRFMGEPPGAERDAWIRAVRLARK